MNKSPTDKDGPKDEPGTEERFLRGIKKALKTKPKPFTPKAKKEGKHVKRG